MATDITDPGPAGNYPWFPRDSNGYPMKHMDKVATPVGKDSYGKKTIYLDVTPRTKSGQPISEAAPRIVRGSGNGIAQLTAWAAAGYRIETFKVTGPNGDQLHIVRNIDTGEQAEL